MTRWAGARERIRGICAAADDERAQRAAVLREIRRAVPFDAYVWAVTDPQTCVGASPLAEVPSLGELPRLIRSKYLTPVNRWTVLPARRVATLVEATGGRLTDSMLWRELLAGEGVHDVASAVLRDRHGCWGFLDLWRSDPGTPAFSPDERDLLESVLPDMTAATRRGLASTFATATGPEPAAGPAVLLLTDELEARGQTPQTDAALRALLPTPAQSAPVPAVALNVAAQLLAVRAGVDAHPPSARLHGGGGRWVTVRAAWLARPPAEPGPTIAVTLERATAAERTAVYGRALGLTPRETELVAHLVAGADTRATAKALGIAEHTVNDHLKSIFAKSGTHSRRLLVARASG